MPKWCPNGSQNYPKSIKNPSQTESGLKNVIFSKIAPRLHETLIFEGPGSPKHPQSQPKTLLKNRIDFCIDFWTVFFLILAPFWDPLGLPLGTKIGKKGARVKGTRGSWRKLRAQAGQGRHQTPKILQKAPHLDPRTSKMMPKGYR